jgi:hypothetical protein
LDGAGIPVGDMQYLELQVGRSVAEWRDNPQAADEIDARLRRHGFDDSTVNTELFCQTRGVFGMLDDLMHAAQRSTTGLAAGNKFSARAFETGRQVSKPS